MHLDADAVARLNLVDTLAQRDDLARELVAGDVRKGRAGEQASQDLLVRAAHRRRLHAQERLSAAWRRRRHLADREPPRARRHNRLHRSPTQPGWTSTLSAPSM